jgi:hypothetical protein
MTAQTQIKNSALLKVGRVVTVGYDSPLVPFTWKAMPTSIDDGIAVLVSPLDKGKGFSVHEVDLADIHQEQSVHRLRSFNFAYVVTEDSDKPGYDLLTNQLRQGGLIPK